MSKAQQLENKPPVTYVVMQEFWNRDDDAPTGEFFTQKFISCHESKEEARQRRFELDEKDGYYERYPNYGELGVVEAGRAYRVWTMGGLPVRHMVSTDEQQ